MIATALSQLGTTSGPFIWGSLYARGLHPPVVYLHLSYTGRFAHSPREQQHIPLTAFMILQKSHW